jgi:hypothetical protein
MTVSEESREREVRAAQNQSLFREINERVKDLNEGFSLVLPIGEWVCECANEACTQRISMSAQEYETIRSDGVRFFVAPSEEHVWPDVESRDQPLQPILGRREGWTQLRDGQRRRPSFRARPENTLRTQ